MRKRIASVFTIVLLTLSFAGCDIASWESGINDIKGQLIGNKVELKKEGVDYLVIVDGNVYAKTPNELYAVQKFNEI